ncbi:MAG: AAA family ATPase [bacterium]
MGIYINPGNSGFTTILNGDYVDKTGLIRLINKTIDTPRKLTCISRPRRFGKSYAAKMLCAYYDKTCDSRRLFDGLEISGDPSFEKHLGRYDVIYLDMSNILGNASEKGTVPFLRENLTSELLSEYPGIAAGNTLDQTLISAVEYTGNRFIMIIDEWDAPIRETPDRQEEYLRFLRMLFKGSGTTDRIFAAVYMTGILPIKKDGSQSAISDFREFTMIKPRKFGQYVGFTENEVLQLCRDHDIDFEAMKTWYDGYRFSDTGSVYNPNSVMQAIENQDFDSYWTESSASESLMKYLSMDYNGLTRTVAELIGGIDVQVNTTGFANDLTTFKGKDDVLTLLIHLGYLAYDSAARTVHIPNEEIRLEFSRSVREVRHPATIKRIQESERLILDTIHKDAQAVAMQIKKIHGEETSPLHYREESLRSVIKLAYYAYKDQYLQWEELPEGEGYADVVYIPKKESLYPALVIELKWNVTAQGAIDQIKRKKYPHSLEGYGGKILLVGISYNKNDPAGERRHSCVITEYSV